MRKTLLYQSCRRMEARRPTANRRIVVIQNNLGLHRPCQDTTGTFKVECLRHLLDFKKTPILKSNHRLR